MENHKYEDEVPFNLDGTEILGLESFRLRSVGVTIGSSTSHLVFSELLVRRGDSRESRFVVSERIVTYRSPIFFTPYFEGRVDTEKLRVFFKEVYAESGITPDDVDTGAIIITGYAARKENAKAVVNLFSNWAGKFVCATAGPNLESIMAAYGSGAVSLSRDTGKVVLNVDMGGGTAKTAIAKDGLVIDTTSIRVGARVIALDERGLVTRIDEPAAIAANLLGIELEIGKPLSQESQQAIVDILTNALFELIERRKMSRFASSLMETSPVRYTGDIDIVVFSGGVSEYIYAKEHLDFGDLGKKFGEKIRERASTLPMELREPHERIRATVMGAAQYTLQVSGNTIFISRNKVLPLRNLQVVKVRITEGPTVESVRNAIRKSFELHDITGEESNQIALAIDLPPETSPTSSLIESLSNGISSVWREVFASRPLVIIFDMDIAKLVGSSFVQDFVGLVVVDGIAVGDLDYVDIGSEIEHSQTVPVVLKNLVFFKDDGQIASQF